MDTIFVLSVLCLLCHLTAGSSDPAPGPGCGDPASDDTRRLVCFEPSVPYKVVARETETAVLRCVIRNLHKEVVTWMKNDGRDIPLTIGASIFTPDSRVSLDSSTPDEWNLVVRQLKLDDAGEYLCQVNGRLGLMARAYALVVEESKALTGLQPPADKLAASGDEKADKRLLSDDQDAKSSGKQKSSVTIAGDSAVFEDTRHFPLICRAAFGSRDAKANPSAAIEWYHQGVRQTTNASSMDISMSWADSDKAVSVLTIDRVARRHSGEWVCLKRPPESVAMETATHSLTVLAREDLSDQDNKQEAASNAELSVASASLGIRVSRHDETSSAARRAVSHAAPAAAAASLAAAALLLVASGD